MEIKKMQMPARAFVGKTATLKISQLENNPFYMEVYSGVGQYAKTNEVELGRAVSIYKTWDPEKDETSVMPAFELKDAAADVGDFEVLKAEAGDAYVGVHKGSYSRLKEAHEAVMARVQEDGAEMKLVVEEYVVFPDPSVKEEDLETHIVYYV